MKTRNQLILSILLSIAFCYGAWYSFNFISPTLGWAVIILLIIILIYLPYHKTKTNHDNE
jgi:hypothetical protein